MLRRGGSSITLVYPSEVRRHVLFLSACAVRLLSRGSATAVLAPRTLAGLRGHCSSLPLYVHLGAKRFKRISRLPSIRSEAGLALSAATLDRATRRRKAKSSTRSVDMWRFERCISIRPQPYEQSYSGAGTESKRNMSRAGTPRPPPP